MRGPLTIRLRFIQTIIILLAAIMFIGVSAVVDETEAAQKIKKGKLVKLHYTLKVDGEVVDSSVDGNPMEMKVGSGQVIPGFEDAIMGMAAGEKKSFVVKPENGYGEVNPDAFREVPRDKMPQGVELKVGMVLYAQGQNGQPIPARVDEVQEEFVIMDFNHPLAGKTLNFDVEIVSIE